jgi:hypothetical protein
MNGLHVKHSQWLASDVAATIITYVAITVSVLGGARFQPRQHASSLTFAPSISCATEPENVLKFKND